MAKGTFIGPGMASDGIHDTDVTDDDRRIPGSSLTGISPVI